MHHKLLDALSTGWIEEALDVSRTAVSDWRRGKFPERRRAQLAEAVRALLVEREEAAQPEWARRLERRLIALELAGGVTDADRAEAGRLIAAELDESAESQTPLGGAAASMSPSA